MSEEKNKENKDSLFNNEWVVAFSIIFCGGVICDVTSQSIIGGLTIGIGIACLIGAGIKWMNEHVW